MHICYTFFFEPSFFLFLFLKEMINDHFMFSLFPVLIILNLSHFSIPPPHQHKHQKKKKGGQTLSLSQKELVITTSFFFNSTASYLKFLLEPERLLYSRISPKTKTLVTIAALPSNLLNPQQNAARNA